MKKMLLLAGLGIFVFASGVNAEVYRWVDPATGRTIYSDTAPPGTVKGVVRSGPARQGEETETAEAQQHSFATQEAARKFPVLLYTTPDSDFSNQARALLAKRRIPFREIVIASEEDEKAMKNLTGDTTLPTLYVGRQNVRGFETDAFHRLLDMAGYPK